MKPPSVSNLELLPAYIASFVATTAAVASITMTLDPCPYIPCVFAFLLMAYLTSTSPLLFEEGTAQAVRTAGLTVTLVALPAISFWISPSAVLPDEALEVSDLGTTVLMGWLVVGLAFVVRPPRAHRSRGLPPSFLAVPSLTVFGLIATINPNPEIIVAFLIFLGATLFLIGYEQLLQRGLIVVESKRSLIRTVHSHAMVSASLFGVMFATACVGMLVLGRVSPTMAMGSAVARIRATGQQYFYQRYGSWDNQLATFKVGAGPSPSSDTILLTVATRDPGNLRGRGYAEYTGRGWRDGAPQIQESRRVVRDPDGVFRVNRAVLPGYKVVRHRVRMVVDMPSVLFSGGVPYRVSGMRRRALRVDAHDSLLAHSVLPTGTSYTVAAMVPDVSLEALRRATGPSPVHELYLSVPNSAVAVFALAPEITAGARTPYEKVEAVAHWLAANCTYDAGAGRVPGASDAADYFLTKSRRGACDLWATSAALLCRAAGVPTRIVTGYAMLGDRDPESGDYLIRERDAHAWIEAYIPGYGWIPFDVTAGSSEGALSDGFLDQLTQLPALLSVARWVRGNAFWTVFGLLATYLLWLVLGGVREDRRLRSAAGGMSLSPAQRSVVAAYVHVCRLLARAGMARQPGQTPREFLQMLESSGSPRLTEDFLAGTAQLTDHFSHVRYATREPDAAALGRVAQLRRLLPKLLRNPGAERRRDTVPTD